MNAREKAIEIARRCWRTQFGRADYLVGIEEWHIAAIEEALAARPEPTGDDAALVAELPARPKSGSGGATGIPGGATGIPLGANISWIEPSARPEPTSDDTALVARLRDRDDPYPDETSDEAADRLAALSAENDRLYLAGKAAGLEQAAKELHMTRGEAQLMAGEMTAQEWRTVSAILTNRTIAIRALKDQ